MRWLFQRSASVWKLAWCARGLRVRRGRDRGRGGCSKRAPYVVGGREGAGDDIEQLIRDLWAQANEGGRSEARVGERGAGAVGVGR